MKIYIYYVIHIFLYKSISYIVDILNVNLCIYTTPHKDSLKKNVIYINIIDI